MNAKQPLSASQMESSQTNEISSLDSFVSFLDTPLKEKVQLNFDTIAFCVILILAIVSRFYNLGNRVMSHDENTHVYFSYVFSQGGNYIHDPLSHGPFQFHMVALSYLLFGANDFSARIPAALFGIAAIAFLWAYRRYIGNKGALASMLLYVISPFMLYYSRYVRNEAFVMLFGVMSFWAMLRFLESGKNKYLYMLTAVTSLHLATKETGYIYTAQLLIFLGFYFIYRMNRIEWQRNEWRQRFNILLLLTAVGLMLAGVFHSVFSAVDEAGEAILNVPFLVSLAVSGLFFLGGLISLGMGFPLKKLRSERSTSILILLFTLVLPQLSAFPIFLLGWETTHYESWQQIWHILTFLVPFLMMAVGMGLWWNWKEWLINNAIFYSIFVVFFTSLFTNSKGFLSGFVGSLGYWLEQQEVARGGQPWYYYFLVELPFYEFLGILGTIGAVILFLRWYAKKHSDVNLSEDVESGVLSPASMKALTLIFLFYWTVSTYAAYTIAGEKMPWLSVHIAMPLLILAGWFVGQLIEKMDWSVFKKTNGWLATLLMMLGGIAVAYNGYLLLKALPVPGAEGWQKALIALFGSLILFVGSFFLISEWEKKQKLIWISLLILSGFGFLTAKSAIISSYYKYDSAEEFLVYAHSGPGVKTAMDQIDDISARLTGGKDLVVAYDNQSLYPYWWYLREYDNQKYFADAPGKDIADAPIVIAGVENYGLVEPILRNNYDQYEYIRVWWPNQDYYNLNYLMGFLKNKDTRWDFVQGIVDIWLKRDYTQYGLVLGKDMNTENWNPSQKFSLFVRKDVASMIWDYGSPAVEPVENAPDYEEVNIALEESNVIFLNDESYGTLNAPRDLDFSDHDTLYVADSRNHRIVEFGLDGSFVQTIGSVSNGVEDNLGKFNEPWGLTVAPDGTLYVADTWDSQIEKFDDQGNYEGSWGYFSNVADLYAMYGPRDVVVDNNGILLMTDTGNKRITAFTQDGSALLSFGSYGLQAGEFDEPVGLAYDAENNILYVADTWNQRIQAFIGTGVPGEYVALRQWDVNAWYGQDLENKPYLTIAPDGRILVADPIYAVIYVYDPDGTYVATLQDVNSGLGMVSGLAVSNDGLLYVSDGKNNVIHVYTYPTLVKSPSITSTPIETAETPQE